MSRGTYVGLALLSVGFCIFNWPSPMMIGNAVLAGFFLRGALA